MSKVNITVCFLILILNVLGSSDDNLDKIFYNPNGFSLPDKSKFTKISEKTIFLGEGLVNEIIERKYKYIVPNEHYQYFIERFAGECVYLDEFYRFQITGYTVYLLKKGKTEKFLFYNIGNEIQGRAHCSGSYSSTEIEYGFSFFVSDYNFDGVFDRLHLLGIDFGEDMNGFETKDYFPYRKSFVLLLKFFDLSFMDDIKH